MLVKIQCLLDLCLLALPHPLSYTLTYLFVLLYYTVLPIRTAGERELDLSITSRPSSPLGVHLVKIHWSVSEEVSCSCIAIGSLLISSSFLFVLLALPHPLYSNYCFLPKMSVFLVNKPCCLIGVQISATYSAMSSLLYFSPFLTHTCYR